MKLLQLLAIAVIALLPSAPPARAVPVEAPSDLVTTGGTAASCPLSVVGWGDDYYGQSTPPPNLTGVVAVAAGAAHSLALKSDGTVVGWGYNYEGEATTPTNLTGVKAIAAGYYHSLALKTNGTVVGWGGGDAANPPTNLTGVTMIASSANGFHCLALKGDGTIVGWGDNGYGQSTPPTSLTGVKAIAAGGYHSLVLKNDGTVVGWGDDGYGQSTTPAGLSGVVEIAAGLYHSLALKGDGTVVGWGRDYEGEATPPTNLTGVVQIAAGGYFSLAMKTGGTVVGWGSGNGDPYAQLPAGGLPGIGSFAAGGSHSLALTMAPATPALTSAKVISSNTIVLSWLDRSAGEDGFRIERAPADNYQPGNWTQIAEVGADATSFTDAGLGTNGTYWYRVRAFAAACGESLYSYPMSVSLAPPAAPGSLYAALGTTNHIDLFWSDYFPGIDGFRIERAPDAGGSPGTWTEVATVDAIRSFDGAGFISYFGSYSDTVLVTNTRFWYRVRAFNALGDSDYPNPVSIDVVPPGTPNLSVSPFADSANLYFYDYVGRVDGFRIERAPDVDGIPGAWTELATTSDSGYGNYNDGGLPLNAKFWYRVRAFNWVGDSDYSSAVQVTIVPPAAPYSLYASIGATNHVDLSWYESVGDQQGFRIERAPDVGGSPGTWMELTTLNVSNTSYASYSDGTVLPNVTYWYRVRAFNVLGDSDFSYAVSVSLVPPGAPSSLYASAFRDQVNLYWYDYSGGVLGFRLERAPDAGGSPGTWAQIADFPPINTASGYYSDTGLSADTTYWYRVRAYNWIGDSDYSYPVNATIVPPATPFNLTAFIGASNQVGLSWFDYAGDEEGFIVERAPDAGGSPGTWAVIETITNNYSYQNYSDSNVVANASYWYRVRAFNLVGLSAYNGPVSVSVVPPAAPSYVTASTFRDQANLYWSGDFSGVVGFRLERAVDADGVPGAWTEIVTLPPANTSSGSYNDTGLAANVTYWYRVRAYNWVGNSDYSYELNISVVPPATPYYLYAAIGFSNNVDLTWYDNNGDEDGFRIERAPDAGGTPGSWTQIASIIVSNNYGYGSYTDTNAAAFTTNWYRVRAYNLIGDSPAGAPVSLRLVPPDAPLYPGASTYRDQVNLSWSDYSGGVMGFRIERAPDAGGSPGTWTQIAVTSPTSSSYGSYQDTGLAPNTSYWYRVRAYNWIGDSPYSATVNVTLVPPGVPSNLLAFIGATNRLNLYWTDYTYDADGFRLERAPDAGGVPGLWTEIATIAANNNYYFSYTDTNVTVNTTNWYRVRAFNGLGVSAYTTPISVKIVPPPAPSLGASTFRDQVNLSWYGDYYNYGEVAGFEIERAPNAGGSPGAWTPIASVVNTSYYTDTGLAANTTWWYRVRAFNWIGKGVYSTPVSVTIVPPAAPYYLYAIIGPSNRVDVGWYDYNGDQDGFRLERAPDVSGNPGAWTEIAVLVSSNFYYLNYSDTNVTAHTTNWYRVRAYNANGNSGYAGPVNIRLVPPLAPSYLSASPSKDRVNLYWYDDDSYAAGISGVRIERAPDAGGAPGAWTQIAVLSPFTTYYTDTGRAPNTTYWYRVRVFNWIGDSPYSTPASAMIVPPATPAYLNATMGTPNHVNLNWYEFSSDEDGFYLERAPDAGGIPGTWTQLTTLYATNVYYGYYTDTNVTVNTTNWYRVRAFNALGLSDYSSPASVSIAPPGKPAGLTAYVQAANRIALSWYDYTGPIDGYKLERAPDVGGSPGTWKQITKLNSQYFTDPGVTTNKTYWYRVRAFNWAGDSLYSDPIVVSTTPPPAPSNLTARAVGLQVNLAWIESTSGITGFKLERAPDASGSPGTWSQIADIGGYASGYTDYGLQVNQTYWYRLRAYNNLGDSPYSSAVSVLVDGSESGLSVANWNDVHQRIDGFGASSAWRSSMTGAQLDMFFSTNTGVGLSLLRSRIAPDGTTVESTIMLFAQARGARIWSTPWSPPAAFKDSGTVNGGNFRGGAATNQAYASQLARYVVNMKKAGINLYALSIQNEPDYSTTSYESCLWSAQQFHDFLPYLYNTLVASNVAGTRIMLPEQANWYFGLADTAINDAATSNQVAILAAHGYYSSATPVNRYGKALWETEDSTFGDTYDGSMNNAMSWATKIHAYLTVAEVNAWNYWWLISSNPDNEGLTDTAGNPAKRMYVLGQYSRFVRPNYYRIGVANDSSAQISAYKDSTSPGFAIVAINPNADVPIHQTFTLTNVTVTNAVTPWITSSSQSLVKLAAVNVTNSTFTFTLPPNSVVTFVGQAVTNAGPVQLPTVIPATSPSVSIAAPSDGRFALDINGDAGAEDAVQVSSNLLNWTTVFITNSPPMPFHWVDPDPMTAPARFYRIRMVPPLP